MSRRGRYGVTKAGADRVAARTAGATRPADGNSHWGILLVRGGAKVPTEVEDIALIVVVVAVLGPLGRRPLGKARGGHAGLRLNGGKLLQHLIFRPSFINRSC